MNKIKRTGSVFFLIYIVFNIPIDENSVRMQKNIKVRTVENLIENMKYMYLMYFLGCYFRIKIGLNPIPIYT